MNDHRDPLRVCLYSGLNIAADAISNSLRLRLRVLRELREDGFPIEVTAFVQGTDNGDARVVTAPTALDVIGHPAFRAAALHIFEYGIAYDLFDVVFLAAELAPTGAVYHNVTPLDLAGDANRAVIERSMRQRYNLFAADHVSCVSEVNRQELIALGMPEDRLSVTPLPPSVLSVRRRDRFAWGPPHPLRLLYVGRLVQAKGILDLLDAAEGARAEGADLRLVIIGNEQLCDPAVVAEVRRRTREGPVSGDAWFLGRVKDDVLAENYARADVLVMPSYHEGFCVPVIEAFASGAYVVAYDSSNLPNVLAGLGSLVPAGDVSALSAVLVDLATRFRAARERDDEVALPTDGGELPEGEWRAAVAAYVAGHSYEAFRRRFTGLVAYLARRRPGGALSWIGDLEAVSDPLLPAAPVS